MSGYGFTDREAFARHPNDPAGQEKLELAVQLHQDRPKSIRVSLLEEGARDVWLPKALIEIARGTHLGRYGVTIRIGVPRWLAEREGLAAEAGEGQGELAL